MVYRYIITLLLIAVNIYGQMFSRTTIEMGTFISISTQNKDKNYITDGFNILKKINLSLSSYDENALVYKLNRDKKVALDNYLYEALTLSQKYYQKSDGYFDITIGSITKNLYRFGEEERVPTSKELQEAKLSFKGLIFSTKEASLQEGITIDLGGMGKGFAVDKIAEYYRTKDIQKAIISASGDIRCLDVCSIEVNNPFGDGSIVSFRTLKKDMGISTSGNYNRYVTSIKNNHLINPKTKKSQNKFISITLISKMQNSDLDAYATTASVMPVKKAYEFLNGMDVGYIIMQSDKSLHLSDNISGYTRDLVLNDTLKK